MARHLPVIDIAPLLAADPAARAAVAAQIGRACRAEGFFYVTGHGIGEALLADLDAQSRAFFALPDAEKGAIPMSAGGPAWRGWFPVGGELTSGKPDLKEGLYLGEELGPDDARVRAGWPLHGANLWPPGPLKQTVLDYMAATTRAGQAVLEGIALSLDLPAGYFRDRYTAKPTILFRIFHYPAQPPSDGRDYAWGVGEHTDYGLITLLAQDRYGGLEVKGPAKEGGGGWIAAPPIDGALVCNIGDMLDRLTGGEYRSTPHRVANRSGHDRLSFPLFLDPGFDTIVEPLPGRNASSGERWDGADLSAFTGTYGDYLLGKVGKVFPSLKAEVL
ncbi:MAG: iron oxidase [Caulobacter sp.]|nr:iron oxidase [Caulobacter sp.]